MQLHDGKLANLIVTPFVWVLYVSFPIVLGLLSEHLTSWQSVKQRATGMLWGGQATGTIAWDCRGQDHRARTQPEGSRTSATSAVLLWTWAESWEEIFLALTMAVLMVQFPSLGLVPILRTHRCFTGETSPFWQRWGNTTVHYANRLCPGPLCIRSGPAERENTSEST